MANRLYPQAYIDTNLENLISGAIPADSATKSAVASNRAGHPSLLGATSTGWTGGGVYLLERGKLDELIQENIRLRQDIGALIEKVSELIAFIGENFENKTENMIVLREITREQAKKEIADLFQASGSLYYSDIAENLRLDLELVVDLCSELEKEGKIKLK